MPVYSHSRLSTFEQCPRRYKFRYIDKISSEQESIEAFLGSRVHETLEKLYETVSRGDVPPLEAILALYDGLWEKEMHPHVVIVREEYAAGHYHAIGRQCLENYYRRFAPFDQSQTLGLEKHVEVHLDRRREYRLQGYIDRLAYAGDGVYEIHDYKTSREPPSSPAELNDRQLGLYELGLREEHNDVKEVRLIWHYLTPDHDIMITTTEPYRKNLAEETRELIDRIERATDFPTRVSALCHWCEYAAVCPAKRHEIAVAVLTPEQFQEDDGVRLVDAYAAANADKRELKKRIEEIRDRLLGFARGRDMTVVQGSGAAVKIMGGPKTRFVTATESLAQFQALTTLVRDDPVLWDQVSTLDAAGLLKLFEAGKLNPRQRELLTPFLREQGTYWLKILSSGC